MKAYTFHVHGMHCKSCVVLTESELNKVPEVSGAKASLKDLSGTCSLSKKKYWVRSGPSLKLLSRLLRGLLRSLFFCKSSAW
ncbi:MAG: hypothetical protein UX14_C0008G0010 [Parcubacteria group bacterium GW2011_GWF1_45_5]|nr:MAG: hypothetical protein UX14_C0008G0010 [Parcubacteria group bacterium GW2011_GWF1_45_5]